MKEVKISSVRNQVSRGFIWFFSTSLSGQIVSWTLTLVIARLLTPSDYGVLALSDTLLPYLLTVSTLKLDVWYVQKKSLTMRDEEAAFSILLVLGLIIAILTVIVAPFVGRFYGEPNVEATLQCFALLFPLRAIQLIPEGRMRKDLRFKELGLANLLIGIFRGLVQIALAYKGFHFWSLVAGALVSEVAKTLFLLRVGGTPKKPIWDTNIFRELVNFGLTATTATVSWIVFSTSDNVVVGKLFGAETLGFYAMAYYLMDLPLSKVQSIIAPLILPYFSKLRDHQVALKRTFIRSSSMLLLIVAPILAGAFAISSDALPFLLGEKWAPIVLPFKSLAFVGLLRTIPAHASNVLYALGHQRDVMKSQILPAIVLPICFVTMGMTFKHFLGSNEGMLGIYLVWFLIFPIVGVLYSVKLVGERLNFSSLYFLTKLAPALLGAVAIVTVVKLSDQILFTESLELKLALKIMLGGIIYPLFIFICFRRTALETLVSLRRLRKN